jgi:hypothetical protein
MSMSSSAAKGQTIRKACEYPLLIRGLYSRIERTNEASKTASSFIRPQRLHALY